MAIMSFFPAKSDASDNVYLGGVLLAWLNELNDDKSARSLLRRSSFSGSSELGQRTVYQDPAFNRFLAACRKTDNGKAAVITEGQVERLAAVASIVSHLDLPGEEKVLKLGPFLQAGNFSESRLKSLVRTTDIASFVRGLRSGVDIAKRNGKKVDPLDVAQTTYWWDKDGIRRNLIMSYYDTAYNTTINGNDGDVA